MTFKEKHLIPLILTAALTTSCSQDKRFLTKDKVDNQNGLLDKRPLLDTDKYGKEVTLYQVDVPVFNKDGSRIEGQCVLTRGLNKSSYESTKEPTSMHIKSAYLNGSRTACFVKVDGNNAVYTERGFCGLFVDDNKNVVVVDDENISQFITDLGAKNIERSSKNEIRKVNVKADNNEFLTDLSEKKDTLFNEENKDTVSTKHHITDSVSGKVYTDAQFLDTLQNIRKMERD